MECEVVKIVKSCYKQNLVGDVWCVDVITTASDEVITISRKTSEEIKLIDKGYVLRVCLQNKLG